MINAGSIGYQPHLQAAVFGSPRVPKYVYLVRNDTKNYIWLYPHTSEKEAMDDVEQNGEPEHTYSILRAEVIKTTIEPSKFNWKSTI